LQDRQAPRLAEINILNLDGSINAEGGGASKAQTVKQARKAVKAALEEKGLERGSKPHKLMRCRAVSAVAPWSSPWSRAPSGS
jgi:valyl-tRNA synthetase